MNRLPKDGRSTVREIASAMNAKSIVSTMRLPEAADLDVKAQWTVDGFKRQLSANADWIYLQVDSINDVWGFAVGSPDPTSGARIAGGHVADVPVFLVPFQTEQTARRADWLSKVQADIAWLRLQAAAGERLTIWKNAVTGLFSSSRAVENIRQCIEVVEGIAKPAANNHLVIVGQAAALPDEFSELQDLADRWAIADDLAREEQASQVPRQELQDLVDRVMPKATAINRLLASVPEPHNERLLAAHALLLAAAEAKNDLQAAS